MTQCPRCHGEGERSYANTNTWRRRGIAGQAFTKGVCDECWGSGDLEMKGLDLRRIENIYYEWYEKRSIAMRV